MRNERVAIASVLVGAMSGALYMYKQYRKKLDKMSALSDKHLALYQLMDEWVRVKQEGGSVADYLSNKGYRTIAVYGAGIVGQTLIEELQGSAVSISYAVDKNIVTYSPVKTLSLQDELPEVDAMIVTPITYFEEIEQELKKKISCPILSIDDVIFDI